ncbi:exported hypothetical protein [Cupriavidus taiwanensis]|nr:exported hypothetical protein [Cupriavidus taiwanensis]
MASAALNRSAIKAFACAVVGGAFGTSPGATPGWGAGADCAFTAREVSAIRNAKPTAGNLRTIMSLSSSHNFFLKLPNNKPAGRNCVSIGSLSILRAVRGMPSRRIL